TLNPQLPCASPSLADRWIAHVADLVPALDAIARETPNVDLLVPQVAAFVGARSERALDQPIRLLSAGDDADAVLGRFRLLASLQDVVHPRPLNGLSAWIGARAGPLLERWRNRDRRAEVEARLRTLAAEGQLGPLLALLDDAAGQQADTEGLTAARNE